MELYVDKEIKDKVEPLEENLRDLEKKNEKLATRLKTLDEQLRGVDKKHVGISNAILSKQGIILNDITELNILREYARIHEKESNNHANDHETVVDQVRDQWLLETHVSE